MNGTDQHRLATNVATATEAGPPRLELGSGGIGALVPQGKSATVKRCCAQPRSGLVYSPSCTQYRPGPIARWLPLLRHLQPALRHQSSNTRLTCGILPLARMAMVAPLFFLFSFFLCWVLALRWSYGSVDCRHYDYHRSNSIMTSTQT